MTANASDFINLTKKSGQDLAEAKNMIFRLIKIDGQEFFSYPKDDEHRDDRICVEIEKAKIVKATIQ